MHSSDPAPCDDIQRLLDQLIHRVRLDVALVPDPGFRALLEASAEVLLGLKSAYRHHDGRFDYLQQPMERSEGDKADFYRTHLSPH